MTKPTVRHKIVQIHPQLTNPQCLCYSLQNRDYKRDDVIVIHKSKEPFGGLLNMPNAYPTTVNGIHCRNLEALYQCTRFPNDPALQQRIIDTPSGLIAKRRITSSDRDNGRPNWYQVKVLAMRWCLKVKLACNYDEFGALLDSTGDKTIVETSPDGNFWGAVPQDKNDPNSQLSGANVFGQLLMELREEYRTKSREEMLVVEPLDIDNFLLLGEPIRMVDCR